MIHASEVPTTGIVPAVVGAAGGSWLKGVRRGRSSSGPSTTIAMDSDRVVETSRRKRRAVPRSGD